MLYSRYSLTPQPQTSTFFFQTSSKGLQTTVSGLSQQQPHSLGQWSESVFLLPWRQYLTRAGGRESLFGFRVSNDTSYYNTGKLGWWEALTVVVGEETAPHCVCSQVRRMNCRCLGWDSRPWTSAVHLQGESSLLKSLCRCLYRHAQRLLGSLKSCHGDNED